METIAMAQEANHLAIMHKNPGILRSVDGDEGVEAIAHIPCHREGTGKRRPRQGALPVKNNRLLDNVAQARCRTFLSTLYEIRY